MKRYWDSSALIDCIGDERLTRLSQEKDQFTRPHSLAEIYSSLTGSRLGFRLKPSEAAATAKQLTSGMNYVELTADEVQAALEKGEKLGVRGGHVHDLLHACAAKKARVEVLYTVNLSHFQPLAEGFRVELP